MCVGMPISISTGSMRSYSHPQKATPTYQAVVWSGVVRSSARCNKRSADCPPPAPTVNKYFKGLFDPLTDWQLKG